MTIVVVTGLAREARIVRDAQVKTIVSGGRGALLRQRLSQALDSGVEAVISFGIAGGLMPTLKPGDCVIATRIVGDGATFETHAGWAANLALLLPHAHVRPIAGTDRMLIDPAMKSALYRSSGAAAADMESLVAAEFAARRNLPFMALRAISDSAEQALPVAVLDALTENGGTNLAAVLRSVWRKPAQIPPLIRTGREAAVAFRTLLRCRRLLGACLGAVDFGELALDMR